MFTKNYQGSTKMKKLISLYDNKSQSFTPPITYTTQGVAVRQIESEMEHKDSMLHKYPDDYTIYELGTFDENTGIITAHPEKKHIIDVNQIKETK